MLTVDVPIYGGKVVLFTRRKAFQKVRAKYTDQLFDLDDCDGISSDHGTTYLVGVFNGKLSVLVHELAHTTFKILDHCAVPVHREGQMEAFCYLQEWLVEQLADHITREKRHG